MPAEATKAAPAQEVPTTPKKKSLTSGKAAVAKVTLLDGSILEVTIDVRVDELNQQDCKYTKFNLLIISEKSKVVIY